MSSPSSGIKAEIEVYICRFWAGFCFQVYTTKETLETILSIKQLNKKCFLMSVTTFFIYNLSIVA